MPVVRAAEALGQEALERAAERLLPRQAEQLLGGSVEEHDLLLSVDGDHRVHRRVDDRREPGLALFQRDADARGEQDAGANHQHVGDDHPAEEPRRFQPAQEGDRVQPEQRDQRGRACADHRRVAK